MRRAYYRAEARRVDALAAASTPAAGRVCFERVAREYRALAEALEFHEPHIDPVPAASL
ncbi:MAG: hypothetical protein U1C74_17265 [Phenylobacterium sp.]|nr:hypothetical protein [Phenylobacterium sp.]